jgi:hypothetical protein
MKALFITMVGGVTSLCAAGAASAAPPAWCRGAPVEPRELSGLSSKNPREVVKTFVTAACAPSAESEAQRGEIEAARQAWSKRLGMTEADWADAVPYAATRDDFFVTADVSVKSLAQATPIDQYAVIAKAAESSSEIDALYAADMFEPNLSEAGRLAFVQAACLRRAEPTPVDAYGMTGTEAMWAICQPDLERIDTGKLFAELRADTAHAGAIKMKLRIAGYELATRLADHAAEVAQMKKRDDANGKLFEIAAGARAAWAAGIGKNAKLLEVVLAMDSAAISQSRKLLEGCSETTAAALADAVATLPASAFAGLRDNRDDQAAGFASGAVPVLAGAPAVELAAIAALRCTPDGELAALLDAIVDTGAPARGPRNAALGKILGAKLTYDKAGAKLEIPRPKPYGSSYPDGGAHPRSAGGVVKSVKRSGDTLTVELQQVLIRTEDCVRSHDGKVARIHGDGRIERESVCDKTQVRTHDHTWDPFRVSAKYAAQLVPGAVFSAMGPDVIAVWPSASAKQPSIVLGGAPGGAAGKGAK